MQRISNEWQDYECIDAGNGEKLERWGNIILRRPDPQAIWNIDKSKWKYDAYYHRSNKGGGYWEYKNRFPEEWTITYKNLTFKVSPTGFKHTGIFPEQAVNWNFMINKIKNSKRDIKVLNLFAYTGGASVACLSAGAYVTHVDSSRGMVDWCKENVNSSGYQGDHVRYIVDDVVKFVEREIRRGKHYDAIIMDPPSYGRGANGEVWDIEKNLFHLVSLCTELLSDNPLFFLINSYTTGLSPMVLENILKLTVQKHTEGIISSGEVGLPITKQSLVLPCGIFGRWESYE